jgi:hypothetical protein
MIKRGTIKEITKEGIKEEQSHVKEGADKQIHTLIFISRKLAVSNSSSFLITQVWKEIRLSTLKVPLNVSVCFE